MDTGTIGTHYYHADATALGGMITTPIQQMIPAHAPISLPPVGGHASAEAGSYALDGILSFKRAYTRVAGSVSNKNQGRTTMVTSTVEGLNVLDVLTCDRIVSQISGSHPARNGHEPKVSFVGTRFENLRVGGYTLDVVLNLDLCSQGTPGQYPKQPCVENQGFLDAVTAQYSGMAKAKCMLSTNKDQSVPGWAQEVSKLNAKTQRDSTGVIVCSLVSDIRGQFPGRAFGHVLEIPDFGKVYLAELVLDRNTFRVIMMRIELGCSTAGFLSAGAVAFEGKGWP